MRKIAILPSADVGGGLGWRTDLRRKCLSRRNSAKDDLIPNDPTLPHDRARALRADATEAEQKLWSRLRKRQVCGFQFRRQYLIGSFFVDFVCLRARLIIEVDGSQHVDREKQDESRSEFLRASGYTVLRFWNFEVMSDVDAVVERIADVLGANPKS